MGIRRGALSRNISETINKQNEKGLKKKATIVLLDTAFPYEKVEPFLETEILYYKNKARVFIANCLLQDDTQKRNIGDAIVLDISKIKGKGIRYLQKILLSIKVLFMPQFWTEFKSLKKQRRINFHRLIQLLFFMADGELNVRKICRALKDQVIGKPLIFYSYWMHVHAYAAARLKHIFPDSKFVTRCHRYDLYEERNNTAYLPLRKYIIDSADKIFSISKDGEEYIYSRYHCPANKIQISRLGTKDFGEGIVPNRKTLEIVSCSWIVKVKRVELILEAIMNIPDVSIKWTHFGGGELFEELQKRSRSVPDNIEICLRGNVSNQEIHDYYKEHGAHVFVNVSESEGIPVSIMEAMSYGIPVIATNVGGVGEIVNKSENILLQKDFRINDLIDALYNIYRTNDFDYTNMRKKVRETWLQMCDADKLYRDFVNTLCHI